MVGCCGLRYKLGFGGEGSVMMLWVGAGYDSSVVYKGSFNSAALELCAFDRISRSRCGDKG